MGTLKTIVLVGLPGSGKTSRCRSHYSDMRRVSQDEVGGSRSLFFDALKEALASSEDVVIDRCNHTVESRAQILDFVKKAGRESVEVVYLKTRRGVCIQRVLVRQNHPTLGTETDAVGIVSKFHKEFQMPSLAEGFSHVWTIEDETPEFAVLDLQKSERPLLVIGDIHGCLNELIALEEKAIKRCAELGWEAPQFVSVGDLVDRGPQNIEVLRRFIAGAKALSHFCIQGNHENRFRRYLIGNPVKISHGLTETIIELSQVGSEEKKSFIDFIGNMPSATSLPHGLIAVHGGVNPKRPLHAQNEETLLYARYLGGSGFLDKTGVPWFQMPAHEQWNGKTVVFGHWIGDDYAGSTQGAEGEKQVGNRQEKTTIDASNDVARVPSTGYKVAADGVAFLSIDTGAVSGGFLSGLLVPPASKETPLEFEVLRVNSTPQFIDEEDREIQGSSVTQDKPFAALLQLCDKGLLTMSETTDPSGRELILFNYTDQCTYARAWTADTLNARGTIYDKKNGQIVALAFPKFFNMGENETTQSHRLPFDQPFQVFEKMDGSMGLIYPVNRADGTRDYAVSTRGSFKSPQAIKATQLLAAYDTSAIPEGISILVEIIYPSNRIQVNYSDREELVVIGAFDSAKAAQGIRRAACELSWAETEAIARRTGMPLCPVVQVKNLEELLAMQQTGKWDEAEGWVVRMANNQRVKIKTAEYMRIARFKSRLSPLTVWDAMTTESLDEFLAAIPEELRPEAEALGAVLQRDLDMLLCKVSSLCRSLNVHHGAGTDKDARKALAQAIFQATSAPDTAWMRTPLLGVLSGQNPRAQVLKLLRPTQNAWVDVTGY